MISRKIQSMGLSIALIGMLGAPPTLAAPG